MFYKRDSATFKLFTYLDQISLMSYKKFLNDKLKKVNWKHQNHAFLLFPPKRVNAIDEARMFFLILLRSYSFCISPP